MLGLVFPGAVLADQAETDYQKARGSYSSLQDSARKKLYRENWVQVIDGFLAVARSHPGHRRAPDALYLAGKACQGLYEISRSRGDALRAVETYDRVADEYPRDSLADDALLLAGELLESALQDPVQAYLRYQRAAEQFSGGDMASLAKKNRERLAGHAPARPASPPPAAPAPAKAKAQPGSAGQVSLNGLRFWSNPGYTRVVVEMSGSADYTANFLPGDPKNGTPPRIYVDLQGVASSSAIQDMTSVDDGLLRQIRAGRPDQGTVRIVLDLFSISDYKVFPLADPYRLVIDVAGERGTTLSAKEPELRSLPPGAGDGIAGILDKAPDSKPPKVAIPSTEGGHQQLRRIVVDAGHGGKDPGAVGPSGVLEKDVTLAMARSLARKLESEFGCEVILTRNRDVFLPLEERTAIANKVGADLFISIHANAARNRDAYGVETYYLNFSKNDKAAAVAARENGTSLKEVGDLELILFDLMANAKINESSRLAAEIQKSLVDRLSRHYSHVRDLGVRQGPFYVLLGATMPSVLVETAFISNHREESRLTDSKYHENTSDAIVTGVRNYATALKMIASQ
ncbi:hypothetical protein DESUT3_18780 [Desulfuromonas versatilis]|uniref:N-acetylmuramoyl-L-alanine amidase n=1 Tax=Desulfuromonas versatilis TaxID=2802975 RepID=A0ABM8HVQ9_9BACT|nr:N-acetylmuramoyl-L-alanine amidase [Desulfuromonas versatilis]BCR04809.1 hypothetical protein DESUT3_18780 [Desulfuromonas versatilis]